MEQSDVAALVADAAAQIGTADDVQGTLEAIVQVAARQLPELPHVGVSLAHQDGRIETMAATDQLVRELDQLQYERREGPCVYSITSEPVLLIDDLRHEQRWPGYVREAIAMGVTGQLGLRLYATGETIGGLNLYSTSGADIDPDTVMMAELLATHAAYALGHQRTEEGLTAALESRRTIGMAIGIVMERFSLDQDRAMSYLVRVSNVTNTKLRDVAAALVSRTDTGGS